jgi:hypothetical protein
VCHDTRHARSGGEGTKDATACLMFPSATHARLTVLTSKHSRARRNKTGTGKLEQRRGRCDNGGYIPNPDSSRQMRRRVDNVGLGDLALATRVDGDGDTGAATVGADGRRSGISKWTVSFQVYWAAATRLELGLGAYMVAVTVRRAASQVSDFPSHNFTVVRKQTYQLRSWSSVGWW